MVKQLAQVQETQHQAEELLKERISGPTLTPLLANVKLWKDGQCAISCTQYTTTIRPHSGPTVLEQLGLKPEGHRKTLWELLFLAVSQPVLATTGMPHSQRHRGAGGNEALHNGAPTTGVGATNQPLSVAIQLVENHLSIREDTGKENHHCWVCSIRCGLPKGKGRFKL